MDKWIRDPNKLMMASHVAMRGQKKTSLLHFFYWNPVVGEGRANFEKERGFRERKSNFSLDFPVFGPLVFIGPRNKVSLRCKGYAWTPILGEFRQLWEVGVFSYFVYFRFKSLINGLVDMRY